MTFYEFKCPSCDYQLYKRIEGGYACDRCGQVVFGAKSEDEC